MVFPTKSFRLSLIHIYEIKYSLVKDNTDKKVDDTGEYQYTVNEVKGDAAGYTYDDTIYTCLLYTS